MIYKYGANGTLFRKVTIIDSIPKVKDYIGDIDYLNEDIDKIKHQNGYIQKKDYCNPTFQLHLSDNEEISLDYYASGIFSTRIINPADSTKYLAEDSITLLPKFEVPVGKIFLADIGTCNSQPDRWQYNYTIKDHLGNTRVVFSDINDDGNIYPEDILSTHDYYPFGLELSKSESPKDNFKYLYQEVN